MDEIKKLIDIGYPLLDNEQKLIIEECVKRDVSGLSLPMGYGKTFISLILGLMKKLESDNKEPILVVMSKSLVASWIFEINKFFGDELKYQILYTDSKNFILNKDTVLVIATIDTLSKYYKYNNIDEYLITKDNYFEPGIRFMLQKNIYDNPKVPYLKVATGGSILYQKRWACLIVDEGHEYTKISTIRCQSLVAICSKYRFILSGTIFDEPVIERIFGYYHILHWNNFPNNLPDADKYMKSFAYKGTKETLIERDKIPIRDVKVIKHVIHHDLKYEEGLIYVSMKKTLVILREYCKKSYKKEDKKKFAAHILAIITYIRQAIVIPILPIANITLNMSELKEIRSELSVILMNEFNKLNINNFLNDEKSARSSRIENAINIIQKHNKSTDKIIVFSCFCTSIDMLEYYVNEELPINIYKLKSTQSSEQRGVMLDKYKNSKENSILFSTYELGANGLNLQAANVVIILDMWWNCAKTRQAIARVIRRGQTAKEVNIYFFSSNTGIEKALFVKQQDKLILLDEIKEGKIKHNVKKLRLEDILKLIDSNENTKYIENMY